MGHIMQTPWEYDVPPFQMTDNVWYVGNAQVGGHLIDTGDGLVLLDTGWPNTLYMLIESIRAAGFRPEDIKWIFHSHYHIDHIGGTGRMMAKYGCKSLLGEKDLPLTGERLDLSYCDMGDSMWTTGFEITKTVRDGEVFKVGNTEFTFIEAPGHTPGTLGIFFNSTWQGRPVRVGMHGGIGRNTIESKYMLAHNLGTEVREDYRNSMLKLRNEHVDVILGNHPGQARILERLAAAQPGVNPFIDDTIWPAFIDEQLERYEAMLLRDPFPEVN